MLCRIGQLPPADPDFELATELTEHAYRDIIDLVERAGNKIDLILISKVRRAADVQWVDVRRFSSSLLFQ